MRYAIFVNRNGQLTFFTSLIGRKDARDLASTCFDRIDTTAVYTIPVDRPIAELPVLIDAGLWVDCFTA